MAKWHDVLWLEKSCLNAHESVYSSSSSWYGQTEEGSFRAVRTLFQNFWTSLSCLSLLDTKTPTTLRMSASA